MKLIWKCRMPNGTHSVSVSKLIKVPSDIFIYETVITYEDLHTSSDHRPSVGSAHGPLTRYVKLRVRMRRECWERFPRHRG